MHSLLVSVYPLNSVHLARWFSLNITLFIIQYFVLHIYLVENDSSDLHSTCHKVMVNLRPIDFCELAWILFNCRDNVDVFLLLLVNLGCFNKSVGIMISGRKKCKQSWLLWIRILIRQRSSKWQSAIKARCWSTCLFTISCRVGMICSDNIWSDKIRQQIRRTCC